MLLAARVLRSSHRSSTLRILSISFGSCSMSMATAESLNQEIAQQTTLFNELRLQNGDPSTVEEVKKKLGELKKSLGALMKAAGGSKDTKKKERLLLKTAKVSYRSVYPSSQMLNGRSPRAQGIMAQGRCSAVNM